MRKRILSGMRPTGRLHLGHLVGALHNWVRLQEENDCLFMVADWHSLMSEYSQAGKIREYIWDNVLDWISVGLDPKKSILFMQSQVDVHLRLYMVLSCLVPLGWLERCPTYKEQLRELAAKEVNTYAFLGYPVLQAADILVYKAEAVPVGEDQLPHLELTREIVRRFNNLYGSFFPEPEALLTPVPRLLGLDGRKMSKSYENTISLSESEEDVRRKVDSMFTDPARIRRSDPGHPEACNLHAYFAVFIPEEAVGIAEACRQARMGCRECKARLAEVLLKVLAPLRSRREEFLKKPDFVWDVLKDGAQRATALAEETMREVMRLVFQG